MKQFYTYLHCKPNGMPFYVGKGCDSKSSKRSNEIRNRNKHHKRIVAKYGKENIQIFIFPCDSENQAFADEIQQIAQLRREGYDLCNQTNGGEGISGHKHSIETRLKLSASSSGNCNARGYKHSIEAKEKMVLSRIGVELTNQHKQKISDSLKGHQNSLGYKHTIDAKNKISKGNLGKLVSNETRKKLSFINTGKKQSKESKEKNSLAHYGKVVSDETRSRMSMAQKGKPWSAKR